MNRTRRHSAELSTDSAQLQLFEPEEMGDAWLLPEARYREIVQSYVDDSAMDDLDPFKSDEKPGSYETIR